MEIRRIFNRKIILWAIVLTVVNVVFFILSIPGDKDRTRYESAQEKYAQEYNAYVEQIITNADKMINFSIFLKGNDAGYSNIVKTKEDYSRVRQLKVFPSDNFGLFCVFKYDRSLYVCLAFMIFLMHSVMQERNNGMWTAVFSAKNGRCRLVIKRMTILAIFSGIFC